MDNTNLDLIALVRQGAISTYPLLVCSVIVVAVALERAWALRGALRSTARLTAAVVPLLARDGTPDITELERIAEQRQFEEAQGAAASLWVLATIGSAAPFIGLFGTVL